MTHDGHPLRSPVQRLRTVIARFWPLTRPDRRLLATATVLTVLAAAADTGAVVMFVEIVDGITTDGSLDSYWWPAALWLVLALAGGLATFGSAYLTARAAENFLLRLRDMTFGHLQRLGPAFFGRHPLGDLVQRLSGDIDEIEELLSSGLVHAVSAGVSVLFFTGAAFVIRWELALVVFATMPLLILATRRFSRGIRETAQDERAGNGALSTVVEEGIANIALVQAYGTEAREAARLHAAGRYWRTARLAQARLASIYTPLTGLFETFGVVAVLGAGAWEIAQGRLTIGGLVGFATFLGFLYAPVTQLAELVMSVTAASAAADRVAELLDARPEVSDYPGARCHPATRGRLQIADVSFAYPGNVRWNLERFTLDVRPGELVLVTGPSGAGKSTLARLLLRFHDPVHGGIGLDGTDLRGYGLAALRRSVTLLPQETAILDGTVAENIAYGSPVEDPDRVVAAARAAGADAFVRRLPQGYRTRLGHRGPDLSGGQRQRIAIARALVRDTPVLVLDEPTTGLDGTSIAELMPALRNLMRHRTTIVISHELTLGPLADTVVVLDHGCEIERGTHDELLARGGTYALLHDRDPVAGRTVTPAAERHPRHALADLV